jgi:ubiquitin C-terminal hydrolase
VGDGLGRQPALMDGLGCQPAGQLSTNHLCSADVVLSFHHSADLMCRCDGCKQLVPARKQITIWDDPNVLVVHLKRFHDFSGQKINMDVR